MASFPGPNVHRPSRRKLGKGQSTPRANADVTLSTTTPVVHFEFTLPVVVRGLLDPGVTGLTPVSQVIVDSTHVDVTMSGATTGLDYDYPAGDPLVSTMQGGIETGDAGTF
jgi:hypothetical protein